MIIRMGIENLEKGMATASSIINDKLLKEDLKSVVIWIKGDETNLVANNGNITAVTHVDANVEDNSEEETFIQLRSKDINDILDMMRGLKRTKVSQIEFHVTENEAVMYVYEEPIDPEMAFADSYRQVSKYRVTKTRIKDLIKEEIGKIDMNIEGEPVASVDLNIYLDALLPTVAGETREATNNVMFGDEYVYTRLASYAAVMRAELPDVCKGFRLPNTYVKFLKGFASEETIYINKNVVGNGMVILTLKNSDTVAVIKCADMSRAYDITPCISIPDNGIVVDKVYLLDVLKRLKKGGDLIYVSINIENGEGSFKITSKTMTQNIPVNKAKGEGVYEFSIRAELLASVILSHATQFDETIFLYFMHEDKNIIMACKDGLNVWHTKMMGLTKERADFDWK